MNVERTYSTCDVVAVVGAAVDDAEGAMRDLVLHLELGDVDLPLEQQRRLRPRRRRPLRPLVLHPHLLGPRPLQLHVQVLEVDLVRPHVHLVVGQVLEVDLVRPHVHLVLGPRPHEHAGAIAVGPDAAAAPPEAAAAAASSAAAGDGGPSVGHGWTRSENDDLAQQEAGKGMADGRAYLADARRRRRSAPTKTWPTGGAAGPDVSPLEKRGRGRNREGRGRLGEGVERYAGRRARDFRMADLFFFLFFEMGKQYVKLKMFG